ncbi:MAG TPA: PTS mannitol transporter subunit IIA, partial [Erwinia persicina]|nr:PTS mannitol transporter subunit IIA [Erwinia persicina]
ATDSNSHIGIITALAHLFDTPEDTASLMAATQPEQILSIISRY